MLAGGGLIIVLVVAAIVAWRMLLPTPVALITTPVQQGTLVRTVTSSGTGNPQNTINVDYNSVVRTGEVPARIDPTLFQAAHAR